MGLDRITADTAVATKDDLVRRNRTDIPIDFLRRLVKRRIVAVAIALLSIVIIGAVFAPFLAPYDPLEMHIKDRLSGPTAKYLFGTDETGRDMLSLVMHSARISLTVGFIAESIALVLGTLLGLSAGYLGGWVDDIISRTLDALLAFPGILLAMTLVAVFGGGESKVIAALAIINTPYVARVARSAALTERAKDYILAARAIGAHDRRIMSRHIFPNALSPLIVQGSLGVAFAILAESTLSFLGLGVQPPRTSWGTLLRVGYSYLHIAPWYITFPGLTLFATIWSLNQLGDGLTDALNPRLRGR